MSSAGDDGAVRFLSDMDLFNVERISVVMDVDFDDLPYAHVKSRDVDDSVSWRFLRFGLALRRSFSC